MTLSNASLLQKATLVTGDFGGVGEAPLTIEQVETFLRLAITPQRMLPDVKTVKSNSAKWQESKTDFASRIMRAGTEGSRLADSDRAIPTTGIVEMDTVLLRGESPITDESLEDQVEREGFGDTIMAEIAQAAGRDIEELCINGDTLSSDPYLAQFDGWLVQAQGSGANVTDATPYGDDYQTILRKMLTSIAPKYKTDITNMRYYVAYPLVEKWREQLSTRSGESGYRNIAQGGYDDLAYQGIPIVPVPMMGITSGSPDTSFILLTHRLNLYFGVRREVRLESWRDPREGVTSFIMTTRIDAKIAHVPATAVATSVNVES